MRASSFVLESRRRRSLLRIRMTNRQTSRVITADRRADREILLVRLPNREERSGIGRPFFQIKSEKEYLKAQEMSMPGRETTRILDKTTGHI